MSENFNYNVSIGNGDGITLKTSNTYVDRDIVFNVDVDIADTLACTSIYDESVNKVVTENELTWGSF